ncbi:hypothetical protein OHT57_00500 [Streptomyces sp. NBC_00285]|uniref:hypothetical protein n=1 Tax=Streptomyces sp. NBC_00285 TaxID=2975700 RepID=UPI002E2DD64A|nr:hypothetical protein [Streptomyces sp. NBC_00285]
MAITMQSYGLTWTDSDGVAWSSAVAYDKKSAEHRKQELEAAGASSIEVVPVRPGQLPEPTA